MLGGFGRQFGIILEVNTYVDFGILLWSLVFNSFAFGCVCVWIFLATRVYVSLYTCLVCDLSVWFVSL